MTVKTEYFGRSGEYAIEVSGEYACFTRPEMKAERVSYDVITPSAARAIFEAILWKPAMRWIITRIEVMNPIQFVNIKRNEINHVIANKTAGAVAKRGSGKLWVDSNKHRMPRFSVILKDVRYRIHGYFELTEKAGSRDNLKKFDQMFQRRLDQGQCFAQPYLGCREFSADFDVVSNTDEKPIGESVDLGWMLHDLDYTDAKKPTPMFFHAEMNNGVIEVPARVEAEIQG